MIEKRNFQNVCLNYWMQCIWNGKELTMNRTRSKQIKFRLSDEEYQTMLDKVEKSGKKQQEYLLACALEKPLTNTDGLKQLYPELKAQGNNLNQIAKKMNEGNMVGYDEFRADIKEMTSIWQSVKRFLQERD